MIWVFAFYVSSKILTSAQHYTRVVVLEECFIYIKTFE